MSSLNVGSEALAAMVCREINGWVAEAMHQCVALTLWTDPDQEMPSWSRLVADAARMASGAQRNRTVPPSTNGGATSNADREGQIGSCSHGFTAVVS